MYRTMEKDMLVSPRRKTTVRAMRSDAFLIVCGTVYKMKKGRAMTINQSRLEEEDSAHE